MALKHIQVPARLARARNGAEALAYLQGTGIYADRLRYPLPCLVVTDLKMPIVDGFQLLDWMRRQPTVRDIPTIVLSSSGHDSDRRRALELGARAYFVKPCGFRGLAELAEQLDKAWITTHCGFARSG